MRTVLCPPPPGIEVEGRSTVELDCCVVLGRPRERCRVEVLQLDDSHVRRRAVVAVGEQPPVVCASDAVAVQNHFDFNLDGALPPRMRLEEQQCNAQQRILADLEECVLSTSAFGIRFAKLRASQRRSSVKR